jgi:UDP-glucose-4-epimerase GalE
MVEQILRDLDAAHKFRSVSLRYFNACGAHEEGGVGEAHDPEPHLIPRTIMAALGQIGGLEIFGTDYPTRDGTAIRDYLHVADLGDAHVLALRHVLQSEKTETFNLGLGRGYTVREVVASVERIAGRKVPVKESRRRDGDPPELVADPSRARSVLSFSPRYQELTEMIRTAWQWHSARSLETSRNKPRA